MIGGYGAEETQGTEGLPEFYFQTHGAEPGELKKLLDRICGPGQYALKVTFRCVDVYPWNPCSWQLGLIMDLDGSA
jgi:hypothetical protein